MDYILVAILVLVTYMALSSPVGGLFMVDFFLSEFFLVALAALACASGGLFVVDFFLVESSEFFLVARAARTCAFGGLFAMDFLPVEFFFLVALAALALTRVRRTRYRRALRGGLLLRGVLPLQHLLSRLWELHLLFELGNSIFVQHLRKRRVGHGPLWT